MDPEKEAERIVSKINQHELSGSRVDRATTREFWECIIDSLKTQIRALRDDEKREARDAGEEE